MDLATIGRRMDDAERQHMAEGAGDSEEFQRFLQQPSNNVDDSGYFSVQVGPRFQRPGFSDRILTKKTVL